MLDSMKAEFDSYLIPEEETNQSCFRLLDNDYHFNEKSEGQRANKARKERRREKRPKDTGRERNACRKKEKKDR
jgi:hypothetical protein